MTNGTYSAAQDATDNAKSMELRHAITIALQIAKMDHDSLGIQNCFNWNALRAYLQLLVFIKYIYQMGITFQLYWHIVASP